MKKIFFYALGLMCALSAQAATINHAYDGSKTAEQNGTALQASINAADSGSVVNVQAGTYVGNFIMKKGVNVIGGWNAEFTDTTSYATILDANANGRVVKQPAAFDVLTIWENLTIQNGKFTSQQTDKAGSGVFLCDKGQVKHCLIQNNLFDAQSGEASGGGVYENGYTTSVLVDDCIIRDNTASHGGGVRICGVIQNSTIENNTTTINACGGVQLHYGGAMYNCIVRNNNGKDTGGVRCTGAKGCVVANCLIINNQATGTIGGMSLETTDTPSSYHEIYNNTIVGNTQKSASNKGRCGVRVNIGGPMKFFNNVVWGNSANGDQTNQVEIIESYQNQGGNFANNALVFNQVLTGSNNISFSGTDNIFYDKDTNPGFVDASNANYSLLWTSSLVNAGNDSKITRSTDLKGNARKAGDHVDIGAYELPYYTLTIAAFDNATLTVGGQTKTAGDYSLPKGYTATATIATDEGYSVKSVVCGGETLVAVGDDYTLPALSANTTLTITIEEESHTAIDEINQSQRQCQKLIKNGQLIIIRDGKTYNAMGQKLR